MPRISRSPRPLDESGFSLIEVVLAVGLLATIVSTLAHGMIDGLSVVTFARQRDIATSLANEALEQVRALPFSEVVMGNDDLAAGTDPLITSTGSGASLAYQFRGRTISRTAVTSRPPLVPHQTTVAPEPTGTTYVTSVYVTADPTGAASSVLVTVRVTWDHAARQGVASVVEIETLLREYRCTAQAGARPCEPYWFSAGDVTQPIMRVQGSVYGRDNIDMTLLLGSVSSHSTTEQYTVTDSTGIEPGTAGSADGVAPTEAGSASVTATADDSVATTSIDVYAGPPNATSSSQTTTVIGSPSGSTGATFTARSAAGSTAGAVAAAVATGQLPPMGVPALENDSLAQGRSSATQGGSSTDQLQLTVAGVDLGTITLFSAAPGAQPMIASSDRDPGANATLIDDDTTVASSDHRIGAVDVLGLPSGVSLPGAWEGYLLRLSGWTAATSATAGPGAVAGDTPSPTSSGTLSYWNGATYSTIDLNDDSATSASIADINATFGLCTVEVSGDFTGGGRSRVITAGSTGIQEAVTTVGSPLVGAFGYHVVCSGVDIVNVTITVDLGTTTSSSRFYIPAGV